MECHVSVWGVLAFLSLALIVSLILNISHYLKKKQGESGMITKGLLAAQPAAENYLNPFSEGKPTEQAQDNMCKDYEENSPSYDYYAEDDPVYGNLNQDIFVTEECCYEQMKSQPQRPVNQLQVEPTNQMCYASLDHSVKRKCRKPRRKKDPSLEEDEERSSNPTMIASQVSIYLNSEQLAAENRGHS